MPLRFRALAVAVVIYEIKEPLTRDRLVHNAYRRQLKCRAYAKTLLQTSQPLDLTRPCRCHGGAWRLFVSSQRQPRFQRLSWLASLLRPRLASVESHFARTS